MTFPNSFARQEHPPVRGVVNSAGESQSPFIRSKPNFYNEANSHNQYYRGEYPITGAFHLTRHWLSQLMIDVVCLAWWITMMGVFGLAFSLPIIMFALLVQ
jgi:hypothetical protein